MKMALYSVEDNTMGYLFRMQDAVDDFMEVDDNCKTTVSTGATRPPALGPDGVGESGTKGDGEKKTRDERPAAHV